MKHYDKNTEYIYIGVLKNDASKGVILYSSFSPEFLSERLVPECYFSVDDVRGIIDIDFIELTADHSIIGIDSTTLYGEDLKVVIDKILYKEN